MLGRRDWPSPESLTDGARWTAGWESRRGAPAGPSGPVAGSARVLGAARTLMSSPPRRRRCVCLDSLARLSLRLRAELSATSTTGVGVDGLFGHRHDTRLGRCVF